MRTLRLSLAGTVILMLLGGMAAMAVAQEDPAAMQAPHQVTGQGWPATWRPGVSERDAERGVLKRYGWQFSDRVEMDDPRLTGTLWSVWNTDVTGAPSKVHAGTAALVSDGGSWIGTGLGYRGPENDHRRLFLELTGAGDYAGYSALLYWHVREDKVGAVPWDIDGLVFAGALPPYPDPVELPAE